MKKMRPLLLFFAALGAGCSFAFVIEPGNCLTDEDCLSQETCQLLDSSLEGFCVGPEPNNPLRFAVQILPPPESGLLPKEFVLGETLTDSATDLSALRLEKDSEVSGRAIVLNAQKFPSVLIQATNQADPLIPGAGPEVFSATSDGEGFFTLQVRPGTYDIVAVPLANPTLPPIVERGVTLPLPEGEDLVLSFDGSRKIRGSVLAEGVGLAGMRVFARVVNPISGDLDPDNRSTLATTLADGSFELALPAGSIFSFHIEPPAEGTNAFVPAADQDIEVDLLPLDLDGALTLSGLDLGRLEDPVSFVGHLSGPSANLADPPKDADQSTSLTFTRIEATGPGRTFSRRVEVSDGGDFEIDLLPGVYDVAIVTPSASELASGVISSVPALTCDTEPCGPFDFSLERRHKAFGEILDPDGQTSFEVFTVEARPAGAPDTSAVGTFSDDLGRGYELTLDPGVYDLTFVPPAAGGLATWFLFDVDLTQGDAGVDMTRVFSSLLAGQVLSSDAAGVDTPVEGATVRAFVQAVDGTFYPVATTTSLFDGGFVLVVPNPEGANTQLGPFAP